MKKKQIRKFENASWFLFGMMAGIILMMISHLIGAITITDNWLKP